MKKFIRVGNHEVLNGKGFYVSYNPCTSSPIDFAGLAAMFGKKGLKNDTEETALVLDKGTVVEQKFYILEGDFRKEYLLRLDEGFDSCKEFYESLKDEFGSGWSNTD